jgi:hypothetical protein
LPAGFHGFIDLLVKRLPVIERTDLQEFKQRVEFLDIVLPVDENNLIYSISFMVSQHLHGRASETPPIFTFKVTASQRRLGVPVLDVMSLV